MSDRNLKITAWSIIIFAVGLFALTVGLNIFLFVMIMIGLILGVIWAIITLVYLGDK